MSRVVLHPQRLAHDVEGVERVDHLRNGTACWGPHARPQALLVWGMQVVLLSASLALASLVAAVDGEREVGPEQIRCALRHFACAGCSAGGSSGLVRARGVGSRGSVLGRSPEGQNALRSRATSSARMAAQARAASSRAAASRSASARSSEPLVALQTQARARQAPCARSHFSITSHVRTGGRRHSPGGGSRRSPGAAAELAAAGQTPLGTATAVAAAAATAAELDAATAAATAASELTAACTAAETRLARASTLTACMQTLASGTTLLASAIARTARPR